MQDLASVVEHLTRFLGISCDKAQLEAMVESCHQLIEQCGDSEALSICRGTWHPGTGPGRSGWGGLAGMVWPGWSGWDGLGEAA